MHTQLVKSCRMMYNSSITNYEVNIMQQISDQDWNLFCNRLPEWQERYVESVIDFFQTVLDSDTTASGKFWKLEKMIREAQGYAGVRLPYQRRRANTVYNLRALLRQNVIGKEDLEGFSEELLQEVRKKL